MRELCFDYHCDHPELVRLLHWEALELSDQPRAPDEDGCTVEYRQKVAAFEVAQTAGKPGG
jgi:mannose-6-phosphate isomerase class I